MLIENYDKEDPYYHKKKSLGKLNRKNLIRITKEPLLQTVDEKDEEDRNDEDDS